MDLKVSLENIIPLTYARDHFSTIVNEVQRDKLYILTKGGKPAVAIIDVRYLEQLTGGQIKQTQIKEEINKNPQQVGLPKMIGHGENQPTEPIQKDNFGSLRFKPVPPPAFRGPVNPPKASTPPPAKPVTPPPAPFAPKPIAPSGSSVAQPSPFPASKPSSPPPSSPTSPVPAKPAISTSNPPTTKPSQPLITPAQAQNAPSTQGPGSLIMPGQESKNIPQPASPSNNANPKIEVEFSTDEADMDGNDRPGAKNLNPDDKAPAAQYQGDDRDLEEMDIG